jgi:tRNA 2-selenouridine synthase
LGFVGQKLQYFVKQVRKTTPKNTVLVHCWRGGMRSESMAWLLSIAGYEVYLLTGGYKAYRKFIRDSWSLDCQLMVLSGKTGTGKTEIIQNLEKNGQQILDLERCAHHKGSAFGAIGESAQPTNEQFENNLADLWLALDFDKPIWIEDESRFIGKLSVPEPLYQQKQKAITVRIEIPKIQRIERLITDYASFPKDLLIDSITRISRRLGGQHAKAAIEAIENDDFAKAIDVALNYYDKTYSFDLDVKQGVRILYIDCPTADATHNTQILLEFCIENELI